MAFSTKNFSVHFMIQINISEINFVWLILEDQKRSNFLFVLICWCSKDFITKAIVSDNTNKMKQMYWPLIQTLLWHYVSLLPVLFSIFIRFPICVEFAMFGHNSISFRMRMNDPKDSIFLGKWVPSKIK